MPKPLNYYHHQLNLDISGLRLKIFSNLGL